MSKVLVTESHLGNIADAIRLKNGASTTYRPGDMAAAIEALDTSGIHPTGTKNITQNGTHDVTQYASANVSVTPNLQSKTTTENGTVTPDQGYDGLSSVTVNVSGGGGSGDYVYIDTADHTIGVKVNSDGTRVLYFNGFYKSVSGYDMDFPSPIRNYIPSTGNKGSYAYGSDKVTRTANIGYANGGIRAWSVDFNNPAPIGYYWGVLYLDISTNPQANPYEEPPVSGT